MTFIHPRNRAPSKTIQSPKPRSAKSALALQARDLHILRGLFESRLMTQQHITAMYFDGKGEAAKKRLQKLKAHRLVSERERRVYAPAILSLTKAGFAVLQERGLLADYGGIQWHHLQKRSQISDLTLAHELAVMDVKVVLHGAFEAHPEWVLSQCSTWGKLCEFTVKAAHFGAHQSLGKPDALIRIHARRDSRHLWVASAADLGEVFYMELDRSTEVQSVLAQKALCYRAHLESNGLAKRYGLTALDSSKPLAFRVLYVFQTEERRNNFAENLLGLQPPILTQAWLTTQAEVLADPLGAIWMRPLDYRNATQGTGFEVKPKSNLQSLHAQGLRGIRRGAGKAAPAIYRRRVEREAWVAAQVQRWALLETASKPFKIEVQSQN